MLFYNAIAQAEAERFEDIPDEARQILSYMDYHDIVAPLVSRYIDEGGTCMEASNKFGVTEGF
ncbi:MAG: hypothetical protein MRY78_03055, partial [Saprospiraceae bacterium]|nr:hypothetical protein [Saprospiraceae bacterium]